MSIILRAVLAAGAFFVLAVPALASHAGGYRWYREHIRFEDHSSPAMEGYFPRIVANWNAAAGSGIVLDYVRMDPKTDCAGVTLDEGAVKACNLDFNTFDPRDYFPPKCSGSGTPHLAREYACQERKDPPSGKKKIVGGKLVVGAETWGTGDGRSGDYHHPLGCHGVGHLLGLDHSPEPGSCLGFNQQTPGGHDAHALHNLYGGDGGTWFDPPLLTYDDLATLH